MAAIVISSSGVNPTSSYIPLNNNGVFVDSVLQQMSNILYVTNTLGETNGLTIDNQGGVYYFGDSLNQTHASAIQYDENGSLFMYMTNLAMNIQNISGQISLNTSSGSLISVTAGVPSGRYLRIIINGTAYKISLLNDTL